MRKNAPKPLPQDEKIGAIDKLGGMVNRRSTRKGLYSKSSPTIKHDEEALLDQIDKQVGQLLLKSSDIESKLDEIEGIKRQKYTKQTTKTTKTTKTTTGKGGKKGTKKGNVYRASTLSTATEQSYNYTQQPNADFQALYDLVQTLVEEVRVMHEEQTEMREQINQLQEMLISSEEEEKAD